MSNAVHGLLVSGNVEQLYRFHFPVCMTLNAIDRRKETVRYTCFDEHLQIALTAAREAKVTLQRIDHDEAGNETYPVLVQGEHPGWSWE
jgi:hypothetical protein